MPGNNDTAFPPDYPDVLGTITGGARLNVELVQCAFAIYPQSTAIGQPLEALVLLQNICDKAIQVDISLQLPRKDAQGNRMSLITPKDEIKVTLQGGETGLLHIPIVPHLPTVPSQNNLIGVVVKMRPVKGYRVIRHIHGGRTATALNMSPFRLNILREVAFTARTREKEPNTLLGTFNVIAGQVESVPPTDVRYETLWTVKELPSEAAHYAQMAMKAERFASTLSRTQVAEPLQNITEQRFAQAGLPLHPGEVAFVTKTLIYVMEDGLDLEDGFRLTDGRWFNRLTGVVTDQYIVENPERLVTFLYTAVVHDAVMLGLHIVERNTHQKFGDDNEHQAYADEVVSALERQLPIDLGHAYLPLALAGILLNAQIKMPYENLWDSVDQMREAWRGRQRLADSTFEPVTKMLDSFLYEAEQFLYRSRIPRP